MASLSKSLLPLFTAAMACGLTAPLAAQSITDSAWVPVEISGAALDTGKDVFIQFGQGGAVSGNGGCNNFSGSFVTNGDAILVGPLAATMMLCEDPRSAMEMQVFRGIEAARFFTVDDASLALTDVDGTVVMRLTPRAAK